ncbi:putative zinc ribbon protein [Cronobacter turicensis]
MRDWHCVIRKTGFRGEKKCPVCKTAIYCRKWEEMGQLSI